MEEKIFLEYNYGYVCIPSLTRATINTYFEKRVRFFRHKETKKIECDVMIGWNDPNPYAYYIMSSGKQIFLHEIHNDYDEIENVRIKCEIKKRSNRLIG